MNCQKCNTATVATSKFCHICGASMKKAVSPVLVGCLGLVGVCFLLMLVLSAVGTTPKVAADRVASYTPPIEDYISHVKERTRMGDELTATLDVPCGSTNDMLVDEIRKSERTGQPRSVGPTELRFLNVGDRFKVLGLGVQQTRILILSTGKECWIPSLEVR